MELSFRPDTVDEMVDIGAAANKPVTMTPENCAQRPFFTYDPIRDQLMRSRNSHDFGLETIMRS